jgi:hypothetical protein
MKMKIPVDDVPIMKVLTVILVFGKAFSSFNENITTLLLGITRGHLEEHQNSYGRGGLVSFSFTASA